MYEPVASRLIHTNQDLADKTHYTVWVFQVITAEKEVHPAILKPVWPVVSWNLFCSWCQYVHVYVSAPEATKTIQVPVK